MGKENILPEKIFYVCHGSTCKKSGGKEISKRFKKLIKENGLKGRYEVIITECTDRCKLAPVFSIQPDNQWFFLHTEKEAEEEF